VNKEQFSQAITNFRGHGTFKLSYLDDVDYDVCQCCGHKRLKHVCVVQTDQETFRIGQECWREIDNQQWQEQTVINGQLYTCHICGKKQTRGGNPLLAYEKQLCWQHYCEYRDEIKGRANATV